MSDIKIFNSKKCAFASYSNTVSEIVIDSKTNRVLFENNCDQKRAIASTTKILTAICVIENCSLDDVVEIKKDGCGIEGSSIYLREGDKYKVIDLLYGLMLRSGNDAAVSLAMHTCSTVNMFAELMNKVAKCAGAKNSSFKNPHGLSCEGHYSTARDLALITSYAMKNETFRKIVSTKSYSFINDSGEKVFFLNKNKMLNSFDGADGVKTGYTKEAGRCLVSSCTRNNNQVISVVLNCGPMFERSKDLLETAFKKYQFKVIALKNQELGKVKLNNDILLNELDLSYGVNNDIILPLTESEYQSLKIEFDVPNSMNYPVNCGDYLGKMNISIGNSLLYSENLFIINGKTDYTFKEALMGFSGRWKLYENKQISC